MNICINGKTRPMTEEEIAKYFPPHDDDEATESDYIDALQDLGVEVE